MTKRGLISIMFFSPCLLITACGDSEEPGQGDGNTDWSEPENELMDPETCKECHPKHHRQWLGSMHAYAANDPVFLAMNARLQREIDEGKVSEDARDFCVGCHAPLATRLGATEDGLNLPELPQWLKGVNCYFCHNTESVEGTHNNPLVLAMDDVMRGNITDPVENDAHEAEYHSLQDGRTLDSGDMCGSCHDIVNQHGVHLERTYEEWLDSFYSTPDPQQPQFPDMTNFGQTCANCHMDSSVGVIADSEGVPGNRKFHDHKMAGIDVALTPFPNSEIAPELQQEQRMAIERFLENSLCASLCVRPAADTEGHEVVVWLHNEFAGHAFPSGAVQDRRVWVEVVAKRDGEVVYESGVIGEGDPVAAVEDPDLWQFRDWIYGEDGEEVHMFWEAHDNESQLLRVSDDFFTDPETWESKGYILSGEQPDEVSMRVLIRPVGLDVIDGLIESGDLDPAIRDKIQTFEVPPVDLTWTPEATPSEEYGSCVSSSEAESGGCRSPFI